MQQSIVQKIMSIIRIPPLLRDSWSIGVTWLAQFTQSKLKCALLFTAVAMAAALPLLYLFISTGPVTWMFTKGGAAIMFESDRSAVLFPNQCVTLSWDVEGIKEVYINGRGRSGHGTQEHCTSTSRQYMRVNFTDGTSEEYRFGIEQLYQHPLVATLIVIVVAAAMLATFQMVGMPGALAILTFVLTFSPLLHAIKNTGRGDDYYAHFLIMQRIIENPEIRIPHFLFHATTIFLHSIFPQADLLFLQYYVLMAAYIVASLGTYYLMRQMIGHHVRINWKWFLVYLNIPLLLLVGPINFDEPFILLSSYVYPNAPHNPTLTFLKPFTMGIFLCLTILLLRMPRRRWLIVSCMAVLTVLATLAKPSYTLPLLPVAVFFVVFSFLRPIRPNRWDLILGIIIPAVMVLGWQYLVVYGPQQINLYRFEEPTSLRFSPLSLYLEHWELPAGDLIPQLLTSILFPLVVYLTYFRCAIRDVLLNIGWMTFLIGQALAYLFVEVPVEHHGNLTWSGRSALFVLFSLSFAFFVRQNISVLQHKVFLPRDLRFYGLVTVFALHVLPNLTILF